MYTVKGRLKKNGDWILLFPTYTIKQRTEKLLWWTYNTVDYIYENPWPTKNECVEKAKEFLKDDKYQDIMILTSIFSARIGPCWPNCIWKNERWTEFCPYEEDRPWPDPWNHPHPYNENEVFYAVFGKRIGKIWVGRLQYYTEGKPAHVKFNPDKILEREKKKGDLIGFYHTHPNMNNGPSPTDWAAMQAWTSATGKHLLCAIKGKNGLAGWWFDKDIEDFALTKASKFGKMMIGRIYNG